MATRSSRRRRRNNSPQYISSGEDIPPSNVLVQTNTRNLTPSLLQQENEEQQHRDESVSGIWITSNRDRTATSSNVNANVLTTSAISLQPESQFTNHTNTNHFNTNHSNGNETFVNSNANPGFATSFAPPDHQVMNVEYMVRQSIPLCAKEVQRREKDEAKLQEKSLFYTSHLIAMADNIDDWLQSGGIDEPPSEAYEFANHHWCYRFMNLRARNRLTRLRMALELYEQDHPDNSNARYWQNIEINEMEAKRKNPICPICRYDIRNDSFEPIVLPCMHVVHQSCLRRQMERFHNNRCSICQRQCELNDVQRVIFPYE